MNGGGGSGGGESILPRVGIHKGELGSRDYKLMTFDEQHSLFAIRYREEHAPPRV